MTILLPISKGGVLPTIAADVANEHYPAHKPYECLTNAYSCARP